MGWHYTPTFLPLSLRPPLSPSLWFSLCSAYLPDKAYLALHIILNSSLLFHTTSPDALPKSLHSLPGARWTQTHTCAKSLSLSLWHCDLWLAQLFRSCRTEQRGQRWLQGQEVKFRKGLLLLLYLWHEMLALPVCEFDLYPSESSWRNHVLFFSFSCGFLFLDVWFLAHSN